MSKSSSVTHCAKADTMFSMQLILMQFLLISSDMIVPLDSVKALITAAAFIVFSLVLEMLKLCSEVVFIKISMINSVPLSLILQPWTLSVLNIANCSCKKIIIASSCVLLFSIVLQYSTTVYESIYK